MKHPRRGIGQALSGGGNRAALSHMGAMRRLFELGVLQDPEFRTVPSVRRWVAGFGGVGSSLVKNGGESPKDLEGWIKGG